MCVHSHTGVYIPIQACAFPGVDCATCPGRNRGWLPRALAVQGCKERVKLLFLSRVLKGFPAAVGYTQSPLHPLFVQMQCVKKLTGSWDETSVSSTAVWEGRGVGR